MNSISHSMSASSDDESHIEEPRKKEPHENRSFTAVNPPDKEEKELNGLVDKPDEWDVVKENGPLTTEDLEGNKELYLVRMPLGMVDPMDLLDVEIRDEGSQLKDFEINSEMYEAVYHECGQFQPSLFLPKNNGILHHIHKKLKGQILLRKGLDTSAQVPVIDIEALKSVVHSPPSDLKPRAFLQYKADSTKRLGGAVKINQTSESKSPDIKKKKKKKKIKEETELNGSASSIPGSPLQKEDNEFNFEIVSKEEPLKKKKKKKHKEREATTSTSSASESPARKEKEAIHVADVDMFKGDSPKKKKRKREADISLSNTGESPVITRNKDQKLNLDMIEMELSSIKKKKEIMQNDTVMKKGLSVMESPKNKHKKKQSETSIALESLELPKAKRKNEIEVSTTVNECILDQKGAGTSQKLDLDLPELTSPNGKKKKKKKRQREECLSDTDLFPDEEPPKKKKKKDKQKLKDLQVDNLSVSLDLESIELPKKSKKKKKRASLANL